MPLCWRLEASILELETERRVTVSRRFIREILPFLAILTLVPWMATSTHGAGAGALDDKPVEIRVAEISVMPSWRAFSKAIGGVDTPGDLFYFDAGERTDGVAATLSMMNTHELSRCYTHLTLAIGVYVLGSDGEWEKASWRNGEAIPATYITLRNAQVSFDLPGRTKYKVTIDSGTFHCRTAEVSGGSVSPRFSLTVD